VIIPLMVCVLFGPIPGALPQEVPAAKTGEDNGYLQIAFSPKALELVRVPPGLQVGREQDEYHDLVTRMQ